MGDPVYRGLEHNLILIIKEKENLMKIHICLISAQLLANFIPVIMDKPELVCIISTKTMEKSGITQRFITMLEYYEIKYRIYDNMPSSNMPNIYEYALETSADIQERYPQAKLILNITGGTKLMSFGFAELMSTDAQLIYTDTAYNRLEYIDNKNKIPPSPLEDVLTIKDYLKAYGANYKQALSEKEDWQIRIQQRKALTKYLGQHAKELESFIGVLNGLVHAAISNNGDLVEPIQFFYREPNKIAKEALKLCQSNGLLKWDGKKAVEFLDIEKTRYLSGIWLEEYVYHIAKDEAPKDIQSGVKISWDKSQKTHNELDLVLTHRNRILIIECKTCKLGDKQQKDSSILYKADSLGSDLKGLFGTLWVVSARQPDSYMLDRAKDRTVLLKTPKDLKNLRADFRQWMGL